MRTILLISHGSHSSKTKEEVHSLVELLKTQSGISNFYFAFLEIETPSIPEGIQECIDSGATEVFILLNFLNSGKHVDCDIPQIVSQAKLKHPNILFKISRPIGQHPQIVNLFLDEV
ncbi:MAG: CbiX/SirB N-terminal domain-containing protein, partial [Candidatus Omnitrophica bacterium]|nr:CbiX/SirB N-terminal domain-containing protein [Candidatus Omnitrophota bacterium]